MRWSLFACVGLVGALVGGCATQEPAPQASAAATSPTEHHQPASPTAPAERQRPARPITRAEPGLPTPPSAPSDRPRPARWIDVVNAAHALADAAHGPAPVEPVDVERAVERVAVERAIAALTRAFEQAPSRPDVAPARQDIAGRIASLHRRADRPEQAAQWARRGLALPGATVFTAHLHLELARAADALGDAPTATAARARARAINAALNTAPQP